MHTHTTASFFSDGLFGGRKYGFQGDGRSPENSVLLSVIDLSGLEIWRKKLCFSDYPHATAVVVIHTQESDLTRCVVLFLTK